jgi:Protein of unknown function (DUF4232)
MTLRPSSGSSSSRMRPGEPVGYVGFLVLLIGIVLAACGGGSTSSTSTHADTRHRVLPRGPSHHVVHRRGVTPSSVPKPAPTTTTTIMPAGISPPVKSGLTACPTSSLSIQVATSTAASNGQAAVISFMNTTKKPCQLTGYPAVTGVTASGATQAATSKLAGYVGGYLGNPNSLPVIQLDRGQSVSSVVQANPSSCASAFNTLRVAPPGSSQSVQISAAIQDAGDNLPTCDFMVSPVVPGVSLFYPAS